MRRYLAPLIVLIALLPAASAVRLAAQVFTWSVDFGGIFENREGDAAYSENQTIAFTRLSPEIGVQLMDGMHSLHGGVVWNQPIGNGWRGHQLHPTLYYTYHSRNGRLNMHFGMLPRTNLMEQAPKFIWSDSINYRQPNIRGLLLQYVREQGYAELAVDWRQLQTATQREAFNININSRWHPGHQRVLSIGEFAQINHLAKQRPAPADQWVNDDISIHPYVALDLGKRTTGLDSLSVRVGGVLQLERARQMHAWQNAAGVLAEAYVQWRWLGVRETFFAGHNLMPLYPYLGAQLNMGDPQYQGSCYSRTDLIGKVVSNRYVDVEAALNFHLSGHAFDFWQRIAVHLYIDNVLWHDRRDKAARAGRLKNFY